MPAAKRLTPTARALRLLSVLVALLTLLSIVVIGCLRDFRTTQKFRRREHFKLGEVQTARTFTMKINPRADEEITSGEIEQPDVNVETTNLTVVLENVETFTDSESAPWMFTNSSSPFSQEEGREKAVYANTMLSWNSDGRGNGSCASGGSGRISRGYIDPFNNFLGLQLEPELQRSIKFELRNLSLADFLHVNTKESQQLWNTTGEAGDMRRYTHGSFLVFQGNTTFLSVRKVQWIQNLSYPQPIGEGMHKEFSVSGYFVGEIRSITSDREWVKRLDPHDNGYVLGVVTAVSFGECSCYSSNSYWITLRGFPKVQRETQESAAGQIVPGNRDGAKVGFYTGSSEDQIASAKTMSGVARTATATVVAGVAGSAIASSAIGLISPATAASPPGKGLSRLLVTAAFVAKLNEIPGFHTDAMEEFGQGLRIFLGKVPWPSSLISQADEDTLRQDVPPEVSVSDELFGGNALYTTLIVIGFLLVHGCVWLATRKKPIHEQLVPHAWMIYLFSIIMAHVYQAAVLNSMQYLRSHIGKGTGNTYLYLVAVVQFLLIGVIFTAFFITVMVLALKRVLREEVEWVPKQKLADPEMRRSAVIMGEYKGESNAFHTLFGCYYGSLMGPRMWLACVELIIVFLDAICTAVIWNEVACLAILICMYALLSGLFLILAPFVDRIEGSLVILLAAVELVALILEFLGAVGDYDAVESMEFGGVILGFIAIGIAVIIAIYCDLIPILCGVWAKIRQRFATEVVIEPRQGDSDGSDVNSDWSGISGSASGETGSRSGSSGCSAEENKKEMQVDGRVGHNAEQEREVRDLVTSMFGSQVTGNVQPSRRDCDDTSNECLDNEDECGSKPEEDSDGRTRRNSDGKDEDAHVKTGELT